MEEFSCPLCLSLMHQPTKLSCNHTFCFICMYQLAESTNLRKSLLQSNNDNIFYEFKCPLCRFDHKIEKSKLNEMIDKYLDSEIKKKYKEEYNQRENEVLEEMDKLKRTNKYNGKLYVVNHHQIYPSRSENTHLWKFFVRQEGFQEDVIEKVIVKLHETFSQSQLILSKSPFEVERRGWGIFTIRSEIYFKNKFEKEPLKVNHLLSFDGDGDFQEIELNLQELKEKLE